jgi:hypothetical protein
MTSTASMTSRERSASKERPSRKGKPGHLRGNSLRSLHIESPVESLSPASPRPLASPYWAFRQPWHENVLSLRLTMEPRSQVLHFTLCIPVSNKDQRGGICYYNCRHNGNSRNPNYQTRVALHRGARQNSERDFVFSSDKGRRKAMGIKSKSRCNNHGEHQIGGQYSLDTYLYYGELTMI